MSLTINEYAAEAARTAGEDSDVNMHLAILALGLTGESGEVADHIKKVIGHGHDFKAVEMLGELGDVLWYWARLAQVIIDTAGLRVTVSDVAAMNIQKLRERYPDGFSTEASIARVDLTDEARACGCAQIGFHAEWCEVAA